MVGMSVFLASWAMLFFALAYAAAALRAQGAWGAMAAVTGAELPALATALVIASSAVLWRGRVSSAALCGAGFIGVQIAIAIGVPHGPGRSVLLLLSGFHGIHAAVGVLGLLAARRRPGMWSVYWHAVALAWLALAGLIYL
jgi:heme/copper-type cytochrome/quinol oxidase subunit 3